MDSLAAPQNITITPRQQMVTATEGAPSAYLGSASLFLDMQCSFQTANRAEREALGDHSRPWANYSWLADLGLSDFIAKRVSTPAHSFLGRTPNNRLLADTTATFELQLSAGTVPSCASHTKGQFPASLYLSCGPVLATINKTDINPFSDYTMQSGRIQRRRTLHGIMAEYQGTIDYLSPDEFKQFINWYCCEMLAGSNTFAANWLVNRELGAWKAHWAEPWSATFSNGTWSLSLSLLLQEDRNNIYYQVWEYEEVTDELKPIVAAICNQVQSMEVCSQ